MLRAMALFRLSLARVSSYLGAANFAMLLVVLLTQMRLHVGSVTPLWVWLAIGLSVAALAMSMAAWFDRKLVWPNEMGITTGINPFTRATAFLVAWALYSIDTPGPKAKKLRRELEELLDQGGRGEDLRRYAEALEALGNEFGDEEEDVGEEVTSGPRVSVIIPYYKDVGIYSVVRALDRQRDAPPFEVIIVVDGCEPPDLTGPYSFRLRLEQMMENRGSYAARNYGAAVAKADILAYLDSDTVPHERWVAAGYRAARRYAEAVITGPVDLFHGDLQRTDEVIRR